MPNRTICKKKKKEESFRLKKEQNSWFHTFPCILWCTYYSITTIMTRQTTILNTYPTKM